MSTEYYHSLTLRPMVLLKRIVAQINHDVYA